MRHNRLGGGLAVVLCALLSLPLASLFAYADGNAPSRIVLTNRTETSVLVGMEWELYRIASWNEEVTIFSEETECETIPGYYQFEAKFEEIPVALNDLSDEAWQNAAYTLEQEAIGREIAPDQAGISNENGEVYFDELPDGLYLLSSKRMTEGGVLYTSAPVLVEVAAEELRMDIIPEAQPLSESEMPYTVRIDWLNDEGYTEARGDSVVVYIYKNGWFHDIVELNAYNNWEAAWDGETDAEWRIQASDIPNGYTEAYLKEGTQFIIQNTYTPSPIESTEEETTTETTTEPIETTAASETVTDTETTVSETTTTESTTTTTETSTETTIETTTTTQVAFTLPPTSSTPRRRRTSSSGAGVSAVLNTTESGFSGNKNGSGSSETSINGKDAPPKTGHSDWLEEILILSGFVTVTTGWKLFRREKSQ